MRSKRLRSAQYKGDHGVPELIDFISKMPDDILVMILSRLPLKRAVATSILSTRWRFVWRNIFNLDFDYTDSSEQMVTGEIPSKLEIEKYINQVYDVINSHSHPRVCNFKISFDLDNSYSAVIDDWIQFAIEKKVEYFQLDISHYHHDQDKNYVLRLPSSKAMAVNLMPLKVLFLNGVNLNESTLNNLLKNFQCLASLTISSARLLPPIHVGGQSTNLKCFTLVDCFGFESISLYGFGLESFIYSGPEIKLHITDLPNLKELDIGEVSVGFENNVFSQISSCALHLQDLVLDIGDPKKGLNVNSILKLPNVKKLLLILDVDGDDSLLEFTSIAQACPRLETFSIMLIWNSPMRRRRKVRHVATPYVHEHLKVLEIFGYYGRISDLELVVYAIDHAIALDNIMIDPHCNADSEDYTREGVRKREQAARCAAKRQLTPLLPPGVNLFISDSPTRFSTLCPYCMP